MQTTNRRRAFLAGAVAVAAIAHPEPAAASDDVLETLWSDYQQASRRCREALEVSWRAWELAVAQHPPRPATTYGCEYHSLKHYPLDEETLVRWRDAAKPIGMGLAERYEKALDDLKAWEAACDAVHQAHSVIALDERADELALERDAIVERIIEAPPRTFRGVSIKLQLVIKLCSINEDDHEDGGRLALRLLDDLGGGR